MSARRCCPCLLAVSLVTTLSPAQEYLPRFTGIQLLTNKEISLTLGTSNGFPHRIETSTNAVAWSPLVTLPPLGSSLTHTDSAAPYLRERLYRAQQILTTNVLTGDHLITTNGDVLIRPMGHATFVMSWQGLMIYNDPTNGAAPYVNFPRADLILVSHVHGDHFSSTTIDAVRGAAGIVIVPPSLVASLSAAARPFAIGLTNGASTNVLGIKVESVAAYNSRHSRGTGNGYVLTLGGKRIYMSGDTEDVPEMRGLPDIDVAFVCMNVPYTMDVTRAVSAVRAFRPKVVYPYHYRNEGGTFANLNTFKTQVGSDLGIEVRLRKWY